MLVIKGFLQTTGIVTSYASSCLEALPGKVNLKLYQKLISYIKKLTTETHSKF